jgi:hypothetical protein
MGGNDDGKKFKIQNFGIVESSDGRLTLADLGALVSSSLTARGE